MEETYNAQEALCLAIIQELLKTGEIEENIDINTLSLIILEKYQDEKFIKSLPAGYSISDKFYDAIIDEVKKERYNVALCLSGIYIELITNEFLQIILQDHLGLSNTEFNECTKNISVESKLTWLLQLAISKRVELELVAKVKKLTSWRNKIVHYKPKTDNIGNIFYNDEDELETVEVIQIIMDLRKSFIKIFVEAYPQYEIGKMLFEKLRNREV